MYHLNIQNYSFTNYNKIKSILLISKNFNLPSEISEYIYFFILSIYTQKIINNWYKHISVHDSNLVTLISKLPIYSGRSFFGDIYYEYYDLYDTNVLTTLKICYKFIDFNISDYQWWFWSFKIACNGRFFRNYYKKQSVYNQSLNIIQLFYQKMRAYRQQFP